MDEYFVGDDDGYFIEYRSSIGDISFIGVCYPTSNFSIFVYFICYLFSFFY